MKLEKVPENQSVRVGLPMRTANSTGEASGDKKNGAGRTILYARVSTADQNLAHQREQAEAAGFRPDEVVADFGVSGVSTMLRGPARGTTAVRYAPGG